MLKSNENMNESSPLYAVVMDDGGHLHLIASKRTKVEAYDMVAYMEEFDDMLGLPAVTYRVISWPAAFINGQINDIKENNI